MVVVLGTSEAGCFRAWWLHYAITLQVPLYFQFIVYTTTYACSYGMATTSPPTPHALSLRYIELTHA